MADGYKEIRGKLGTGGIAARVLFWGWQCLMAVWFFSYTVQVAPLVQGANSDAAKAGAGLGIGIAWSFIIFFWLGGTVIFGAFVLLTRPARILVAITPANAATADQTIHEGQPIAADVRSAYRPETRPDSRKTNVPVLIGLLVVAVIALAVFLRVSKDNTSNALSASDRSDQTGSSTPPEPAVQVTAITAPKLAEAFEANEVAAQKMYGGGRVLDVTGTINSVGLDLFNNPIIRLEAINPFLLVQATFDKSDSDQIATLGKGQRITVRCSSLDSVITAPMLNHCQFPPAASPISELPRAATRRSPDGNPAHIAANPSHPEDQPPPPDARDSLPATPTQPVATLTAPQPSKQTPDSKPTSIQTTPIVQPSFDCTKAANNVEHLICSNRGLADLDVQMAALYVKVVDKVADPNEIRGEQRDWLARRNKCTDAGCLITAYSTRITDLRRWIGPQ